MKIKGKHFHPSKKILSFFNYNYFFDNKYSANMSMNSLEVGL